jgi:ADP-heptose:LPS heptosyltransferase
MTTPSRVDPARVRRVLLIRPRFIGDICLTLPVVSAIRAAAPDARIGYLLERECAPLLDGDPRIDTLIVSPRRPSIGDWLGVAARIRRFAPDLVLDLFCNPRTAQWALVSGARERVGYAGKGVRSAVYTRGIRPRALSAIAHHLESVAALGWPAPVSTPRLHIAEPARMAAADALAALGVPRDARLVGMHPGARWPTRRWGVDRFADLARRLVSAHDDVAVLVTAGPGEENDAEALASMVPGGAGFVIAGWPLERFVALQSQCAAFVAGDTGPVHTAVASGAPTLGLMSRNRPAMFFPYPASEGHRAYYARVECSPCHRDLCDDLRCLARLTPDGAWGLLSAMLAAPR